MKVAVKVEERSNLEDTKDFEVGIDLTLKICCRLGEPGVEPTVRSGVHQDCDGFKAVMLAARYPSKDLL